MRWAAICALALISGCSWGGDDEPVKAGGASREIEEVVRQLDLSTRASDGRAVCEDLLTPAARARLGGKRCARRVEGALAGLEDPRVELTRLRVRAGGREAVAHVRTRQAGRRALEEALVLTRHDGEWRLEALRR
ncbi:MAG: hypothetical protein JW895_11560 [Thermoleophilaceae bacterium]|nr:hypothetical protein [Thermoleophilaceae bacterium]